MAQKTIYGFDSQMENRVKYSQTREYRPSYYSSVSIELAQHCLKYGNLTMLHVVGNVRKDVLEKFVKSKKFNELCAEYRHEDRERLYAEDFLF